MNRLTAIEILHEICKFQQKAKERAKMIFIAESPDEGDYDIVGVDFDYKEVTFMFKESRSTDCPDSRSILIPAALLDMSDAEFKEYVDSVVRARIIQKELAQKNAEQTELERKKRLYDQLKRELKY